MEESGLPFKGPTVYTGGLRLAPQCHKGAEGCDRNKEGGGLLELPWGWGAGGGPCAQGWHALGDFQAEAGPAGGQERRR